MTAMPTETETRLQEIAEKIEEIYGICGRTPVSDPSPTEAQEIIKRLVTIGQIVHSLSSRFRQRHGSNEWSKMESWSSPNAFSPASFMLGDLRKVLRVFNSVEPIIKMHAYSNSDIQSGIIASLDTWYEQISKDWFDRTRRTYILIYLTVALTILRGALIEVDYELTSHQILVYCSVLVPVLWIAFDIFWGRKIFRVYNSYAEAYETYSEFY